MFYYNPKLKKYAKELRNNPTDAERLLWKFLKKKQMLGYDFHRQKPIENYIVDFFCKDLLLVIEIDGSSHDEFKYDYDQKRQREIERLGILFLRFSEYEVKTNLQNVLDTIENFINEYGRHTPQSPLKRGGEC